MPPTLPTTRSSCSSSARVPTVSGEALERTGPLKRSKWASGFKSPIGCSSPLVQPDNLGQREGRPSDPHLHLKAAHQRLLKKPLCQPWAQAHSLSSPLQGYQPTYPILCQPSYFLCHTPPSLQPPFFENQLGAPVL